MDFSTFAIRDRDDAGYAVDIVHPIHGTPMVADGKPARVIVRGPTSKAAAAMLASLQAQIIQSKDAPNLERLQQSLVMMALPFVAGFENCKRGDKDLTVDDAAWWLDLMRWEIDLAKADDADIPLFDKMVGHPFPVQVMRAVEAARATLGNA